jgi:hypothetical protein
MRAVARKIKGQSQSERSGFASVEDDFEKKNLDLRLFSPIWKRYHKIGSVCVVVQGAGRSFLAPKRLINRC